MQKLNSNSQIDGMLPLINTIGEDSFIKLAIESSYFFDLEAVKDRFDAVAKSWQNGEPLPARKSDVNEFDYIPDSNGNAKVCSIINEYCGYNLNQNLDKKPFIHYIISHVWGNASDPRYFTALWNLALIPAWANHLMDKNDTAGSVVSKLKSTIMAICSKVYSLEQLSWSSINMNCPKIALPVDIVNDTYNINIITLKSNKNQPGIIVTRPITI